MSKIRTILITGILVFGSVLSASIPFFGPFGEYTVSAAFVEEQEGFGAGEDGGKQEAAPIAQPASEPAASFAPQEDSASQGEPAPSTSTPSKPSQSSDPVSAVSGSPTSGGNAANPSTSAGTGTVKKGSSAAEGASEEEGTGNEKINESESNKTAGQAQKREFRSEQSLEKTAKQKETAGSGSGWSVPEIEEDSTDDYEQTVEGTEGDSSKSAAGEDLLPGISEEAEETEADNPTPSDPFRKVRGVLLTLGCLLLGAGLLRKLLYVRKK